MEGSIVSGAVGREEEEEADDIPFGMPIGINVLGAVFGEEPAMPMVHTVDGRFMPVDSRDSSAVLSSSGEATIKLPDDGSFYGSGGGSAADESLLESLSSAEMKDASLVRDPIESVVVDREKMPGFDNTMTRKMTTLVARRMGANLGTLELGAPCVWGNFVAMSAYDADTLLSYVIIIDTNTMKENARADPVTLIHQTEEQTHYMSWAGGGLLVLATAAGGLSLLDVSADRRTVHDGGAVPGLHTEPVRELAVHGVSTVASAGDDGQLILSDLHRGGVRLDAGAFTAPVGSVKIAADGVTLTATLDSGVFHRFDTRQGLARPAESVDVPKGALYTHEAYGAAGTNVLLGFGDGEMFAVDTRRGRVVCTSKDPYVRAVGAIHSSPATGAVVVSGMEDFSCYNVRGGEALLWSHRHHDPATMEPSTVATSAAFLDDGTTIVCTTSNGYLGVYTHDFSLNHS